MNDKKVQARLSKTFPSSYGSSIVGSKLKSIGIMIKKSRTMRSTIETFKLTFLKQEKTAEFCCNLLESLLASFSTFVQNLRNNILIFHQVQMRTKAVFTVRFVNFHPQIENFFFCRNEDFSLLMLNHDFGVL